MATAQTEKPLAAELEKFAEKTRASLPEEALKTIDEDNAKLKKTYDLTPLKEGEDAVDFTLPNATKQQVSLKDLLEQGKPTVLTFYRGAWCPYCNVAVHSLSKLVPDIEKLGAKLLVVTPETPDESLSFKEKEQLKFEVLSDDGAEVAKKYGCAFKASDNLKGLIKGMGVDLDATNGNTASRPSWLPVPATFVIGKDKKIVWRFFDLDYTKRAEPSDILAAVRKATQQ